MSGDRVIVLDGGEVLLGGWYVNAVATVTEQYVNASRGRDGGGGVERLRPLLDGLRDAAAKSCAAQLPQPVDLDGGASWPRSDDVDVEEAAQIMRTSESNIRNRCRRGTLPALKVGGCWVLSRSGVAVAAAQRRAA